MKTQFVSSQDYLYIKFDGPAANEGRLNVSKAGKTLVALAKWKKQYRKELLNNKIDFDLKLGKVEKNCTELQIILEIVNKATEPAITLGAMAAAANIPGVKDFLKEVGGELGRQLMLKIFSKGKDLTESDLYAKDGKVYALAVNMDNQSLELEKKSLDFYRKSNQTLNGMYALEPGKEERIRIGYYTAQTGYKDTGTIALEDKDAFIDESDPDNLARRMAEPFDEDKATEERLEGQFVDFHGLAHKYKFSFQARRKQDEYGKQKILCIVDEPKISEIIDLLKPENKKNICIKGKATRDQEGKIDKIMIEWFNEDANYNPDQTSLVG